MYINIKHVSTILSGMIPMSTVFKIQKKLIRNAEKTGIDIIRCMDCKWAQLLENDIYCRRSDGLLNIDYLSYCSFGERKGKSEND